MGYTGIFTSKSFGEVLREDALPGYDIVDQHEEKITDTDATDHSVFYLAIRSKEQNYIFGCVVIMKAYLDKGRREVMWKEMDESVGPNYYGCPKRIIDRLTPSDEMPYSNEYSRSWRENCLLFNKLHP